MVVYTYSLETFLLKQAGQACCAGYPLYAIFVLSASMVSKGARSRQAAIAQQLQLNQRIQSIGLRNHQVSPGSNQRRNTSPNGFSRLQMMKRLFHPDNVEWSPA